MRTLLRLSVALVVLSFAHTAHIAHAQPPTPTPAPPFDPYHRAGAELLLPILNFQGQDDVCESWIDVQNLGADAAKVALVTWGEPGFCPPQTAGPLKSECSGVVKPGGTWTFAGALVPTGSMGGSLYRFGDQPYTPPWPDAELDTDSTMADTLCTLLFFGLIGCGDDSSRFIRAYRTGLLFDGVPLAEAAGTGQLAATVTRRCPSYRTRGADTTASYNGIALNRVGDIDPAQGGYVVFAPDAHVVTGGDGQPGVDGGTTMLYVQNAGLYCASLDVWFAAHDGCGRARLCDTMTLAPLETLHFDAADCGPPNAVGAMWVRATQPVAVVAERILGDERSTYAGVPSTLRAAFDPQRAAPLPVGPVLSAAYVSNGHSIGDSNGNTNGSGSGDGNGNGNGGLATHLTVMNTHPSDPARIRLSFLDPSGAVRTSLVDWLCPRSGASYDLSAIGDLPPGWHGAARVVALGGGGAPSSGPARLAGVARLVRGAAENTGGDVSYSLAALPEDAAAIPDPSPRLYPGDDADGTGLIVLPSVRRGPGDSSTTIIVHNAVAAAGYTALRTGLFDANGLVSYTCAKLSAGELTMIDLDAMAHLGPAFRGAAVISAWYWDHGRIVVPGGSGAPNPVRLTAMTLDRGDAHWGDAHWGDAHWGVADGGPSGTAGIALRRRDIDGHSGGIWWLVTGTCDGENHETRPGVPAYSSRPADPANDA